MIQDTYCDVLQKPGEWQQINRRENIKSKTKGHDSVINLKGMKYEKSVTLYVRNISVCDNETEQSITFQVKSYVKRKYKNNNIRIMRMNVVRNKYCEDSVGCRVVVPESVSDTLTREDFWPEDIECRVWNKWTRNNMYYMQVIVSLLLIHKNKTID